MNNCAFLITLFFSFITFCAQSQEEANHYDQIQLPSKVITKYLYESVEKSEKLEKKLNKESEKALQQLQSLEGKMQKKLNRFDC